VLLVLGYGTNTNPTNFSWTAFQMQWNGQIKLKVTTECVVEVLEQEISNQFFMGGGY